MSTTNTDPRQTSNGTGVNIVTEERIIVQCPYNLTFIFGAKRLGGKWLPEEKRWAFPKRNEDLVRGLCTLWFGTDGTVPPDLVDVQLTYLEGRSQVEGPITAFGRIVARTGKSSLAARLGEGVVLVEGNASGTGEHKGWSTVVAEGTIFRLQGVPRALVTSGTPPGTEAVLVETSTTTDELPQLEAERIRLEARIADIDATLSRQASNPAP
jgi:hypothetical protein